MRVVFATNDRENLNGHFALCRYFMFYDITEETCKFNHAASFSPQGGSDDLAIRPVHRKPFSIDERIDAIRESDVIFVSAIGGPIADRVIASGVYPIEMNAVESIEAAIFKLQGLFKGKKPLWLKRILKHDFMFEGPSN